VTDGQGYGPQDQPQQPRYNPRYYGQPPQGPQGQPPPQDQPWQPQPYGPPAHQQGFGGQQYGPQGQSWFQPGASQPPYQGHQPPQPHPGFAVPPPYAPGGYQPPAQRPRKSWPARHKVLTGLIAIVCLGIISVAAKAAVSGTGKPAADIAAATTSPQSSPSAVAQPDCATQARNWVNSGQLTSFGSDVGSFGTAVQALASDMENGADTSSDTAAVESAAATIESGAQAVEANPGPACIPGVRGNVTAAAEDYSASAIDMTNALSELSAGNTAVATADVDSANAEMGKGNAKIAAATTAVKNFSASQGA